MSGRLEVLCGPMFAGKTTELLRRLIEAEGAGQVVLALKPVRDTRYRELELATHSGHVFKAVPVTNAPGVVAAVDQARDRMGREPAVIGIDEAHFFGAALTSAAAALVARGMRVICAGVERDHRGRPFEPFPSLLCEADEVVKLSGRCAVCGGPSVHSQRMIESDADIVVGGAEMYQARCRKCFKPGT